MNPHSAPRGNGKRARILNSALKVFASKGFFGAKISDIAGDAGVADGTIYLYFKSKDDLLIKLFEELMADVNAHLSETLASGRDAVQSIRQLIVAYLGLVEQNPRAAEVLTVELRQSAKFMKEYSNPRFADLLKMLGSLVEEGQRKGQLRADIPPHVVARALFGLLDEMTIMWLTAKGERFDLRKGADWIADLVLQGLANRAGRQDP